MVPELSLSSFMKRLRRRSTSSRSTVPVGGQHGEGSKGGHVRAKLTVAALDQVLQHLGVCVAHDCLCGCVCCACKDDGTLREAGGARG